MAFSFWPRQRPPDAAESRILVERLRLLYRNMDVSAIPMVPVALLLLFTLSNDANHWALPTWAAAVIATNLFLAVDARKRLAGRISVRGAQKFIPFLIVATAIDGVIWGALAWVTLGTVSLAGNVLVLAVMTGIIGGAVSLLSPLFVVFAAFAIPMLVMMAIKLVLLRDPAYDALAITSLLYLGSMMAHARNSGTAAREAIELRFENIDLMTQATAAKLEAEQANLAKSKFLAAASHDLRQPIHAQGLFLEVLSHTPLSPHQVDVLASARSASSASSDMLNTLLDFSRIEAGVVKPHNVPFDLQTLLNKIENDLAPQADAKGLVYRTRETNLTIDSDAALVEMILRNLVSNAIRYTEPVKGRGGVLVACRRRGGHAVVEVWDTGIGIAPENCLDIFKEFHQLGNPERDRRKGLGLGLAIADGLAKTLGHRLALASVPGRGSVFKLTLPMTQAPAVSTDMAAPQVTGQLQGAHVLVIDDDETVLTGMAQLLQSWGCQVDIASSISSALEHANRQAPQAIISDYRLRGQQTGAEAIAAVRESLGLSIPALVVTGDTAPERLREALASGVPLLHKPMAPGQLYQALTGLLRAPRS